MRSKIGLVIALACSLIFAAGASAVDVGDPVFKQDLSGSARLEVLYEKYGRKMDISRPRLTTVAASPGASIISGVSNIQTIPSGGSEVRKANISQYVARLSFSLGEKAVVYFDGGIIKDKDAETSGHIIGAGARLLTYDENNIRTSIFATFHKVPSYSYAVSIVDARFGRLIENGDQSWWEGGIGAMFSYAFAENDKMKVIPYAGLMISELSGEMSANVNSLDFGSNRNFSADIASAQPLIGIVGVSFLVNKRFSIRSEGRFIGDSSVSGAVGMAF